MTNLVSSINADKALMAILEDKFEGYKLDAWYVETRQFEEQRLVSVMFCFGIYDKYNPDNEIEIYRRDLEYAGYNIRDATTENFLIWLKDQLNEYNPEVFSYLKRSLQ